MSQPCLDCGTEIGKPGRWLIADTEIWGNGMKCPSCGRWFWIEHECHPDGCEEWLERMPDSEVPEPK